jgi:hypothetical protein
MDAVLTHAVAAVAGFVLAHFGAFINAKSLSNLVANALNSVEAKINAAVEAEVAKVTAAK